MMRKWLSDDSGVVAVVVALSLVVLLGFAAFAVDAGYWYNVRRQLQAASDAAALAGCRDLIDERTDAEIWATVEEYVAHNAERPADASLEVIPIDAGGLSDIGDDFVKVTVRMEARSFFARIFGIDQTPIRAQSRAVIAYATEGRYLVPFSVPIVLMGPETEITAFVGLNSDELDPPPADSDEPFEGDVPFSASVGSDECVSLPLGIETINSQGVVVVNEDALSDFGRILVRGADFPITDMWFEENWIDPGQSTVLQVRTTATAEAPEGSYTGPGANGWDLTFVNTGIGRWQAAVPTPGPATAAERYNAYEFELSVTDGGTTYEIEEANKNPTAILITRRANAPINRIDVSPMVFTAGDTLRADFEVHLNRFEISDADEQHEYELKFNTGGASETGNFGMVDFSKVSLAPNPPIEEIKDYNDGQHYKDQVENGFLGVLHIDDLIRPYTGNVSTLTSKNNGALTARIASSDLHFFEWLATGKPADPRLVYVPVVEQYTETLDGTSGWFRIVAFGAFYLDSTVDEIVDTEATRGYFVEYVVPSGSASENPGQTGLDQLVPRLVSEDVDF